MDLGTLLRALIQRRAECLKGFFGLLAFFVVLNLIVRPHEPHFGLDAYPGFWALFGLGVGWVMVMVMKRVVQPLIVRKEDYYGDI